MARRKRANRDLEAANAAAVARGMSYGQYSAAQSRGGVIMDTITITEGFDARAKEAATAKGFNLQETCIQAGLDKNWIYKLKSSRAQEADKASMSAIAKVLEVSVYYLAQGKHPAEGSMLDSITPKRKPAIINQDFEDAVRGMIDSAKAKEVVSVSDSIEAVVAPPAPEKPAIPDCLIEAAGYFADSLKQEQEQLSKKYCNLIDQAAAIDQERKSVQAKITELETYIAREAER